MTWNAFKLLRGETQKDFWLAFQKEGREQGSWSIPTIFFALAEAEKDREPALHKPCMVDFWSEFYLLLRRKKEFADKFIQNIDNKHWLHYAYCTQTLYIYASHTHTHTIIILIIYLLRVCWDCLDIDLVILVYVIASCLCVCSINGLIFAILQLIIKIIFLFISLKSVLFIIHIHTIKGRVWLTHFLMFLHVALHKHAQSLLRYCLLSNVSDNFWRFHS